MGDFTWEGYNDKPKPCPENSCKGVVHPTWNADVGKCDTCKEKFNWGVFSK